MKEKRISGFNNENKYLKVHNIIIFTAKMESSRATKRDIHSLKTKHNKTPEVRQSVIKESNHSREALQIAVIAISYNYLKKDRDGEYLNSLVNLNPAI